MLSTKNQQDDDNASSFHFRGELLEAALKGNGERVKKLVQEFSSKHSIPPSQILLSTRDAQGRTALHFASYSTPETNDEREDIVSLLLHWLPQEEAIKLLSLKDTEDGITPLMFAARNPNPQLAQERVDTILTVGGNKLALAKSKAGATALHYASACDTSTPTTLERLYKAGRVALETNSTRGGTPLHWAAAVSPPANHVVIMKTLVQTCGANVNALNEAGLPPLLLAAAARNDAHCAFLIQHGADISIKLPGNINILHMAADLNLIDTLKAVIDTHDTKTFQSMGQEQGGENKETPLDAALQEGNIECVMLLSGKTTRRDAKHMVQTAAVKRAKAEAQFLHNAIQQQQEAHAAHTKEQTDTAKQTQEQPNTNASSDEQEAQDIVAKLASMTVSVDGTQRALQLKHQGNEHFARHEWQQACDLYTQAIDLNPTDATFYSNRSACYMEMNLPQQALQDALIARHLRPTWSKAAYRMAVARMALERYEDAAVAAYEGLQHDEDNEELQELLRQAVSKGKRQHQQQAKRAMAGNDSR